MKGLSPTPVSTTTSVTIAQAVGPLCTDKRVAAR